MLKHGGFKLVVTILMLLAFDILSAPPLLAAGSGCSSGFEPSPNYAQSDVKALLKICGGAKHRVDWRSPQGTTAACHPYGEGGCTTHNEYDALGNLIGSTWEFYISGQQRSAGTYTAIVTTCNNYIGATCIGWAESFRANFYITGPADYRTYLSLVQLTSNYTFTVPSGWSGTGW